MVAEKAWLWDDPECAPVARRQVLHLTLPQGSRVEIAQLEEALATHPGPDEVVVHIRLRGMRSWRRPIDIMSLPTHP